MAPTVSRPHLRPPRSATEHATGALRLPQGCTTRSLSDPASRDVVSRWLQRSPDHTLYHLGPYVDFLRSQNGIADVLLVSRDGNALFALAVQSWNGMGIDSGYSGVVFPATNREGSLRRSIAALAALLAANRHLPFHLCQSAQASAYEDLARATLLQQLLESEGLALDPVYGRLCRLDYLGDPEEIPVTPGRYPGALAIDADWLTGESLSAYDPDVRNQIRQAIRAGLTVEYVRTSEPAARAGVYARFQPLHEESWTRTGLLPKTPDYWPSMSESITANGGEDMVVLVLNRDGKPLAGVICHAYQARAIYWSGCSSAAGLSSRANPLCLHGAIVACRRQGVHTFELGRFRADESSRKERSVTDYKAQFGGSLVRITSFSSAPHLLGRVRAAQAVATFVVRRRLALAIARRRLGSPRHDYDGTSSL
jgi:Acetyltransferase (GNAT) domain